MEQTGKKNRSLTCIRFMALGKDREYTLFIKSKTERPCNVETAGKTARHKNLCCQVVVINSSAACGKVR